MSDSSRPHGLQHIRLLHSWDFPDKSLHAARKVKGPMCHNKDPAAKSVQSCPTVCDLRDGSPPGSHPWDSLGKNTGVGCHFLLQYMKVKSESEVTQSCLTLRDPMDCSPPGSSVHGIFQARVLEWGAIAFSPVQPDKCINIYF